MNRRYNSRTGRYTLEEYASASEELDSVDEFDFELEEPEILDSESEEPEILDSESEEPEILDSESEEPEILDSESEELGSDSEREDDFEDEFEGYDLGLYESDAIDPKNYPSPRYFLRRIVSNLNDDVTLKVTLRGLYGPDAPAIISDTLKFADDVGLGRERIYLEIIFWRNYTGELVIRRYFDIANVDDYTGEDTFRGYSATLADIVETVSMGELPNGDPSDEAPLGSDIRENADDLWETHQNNRETLSRLENIIRLNSAYDGSDSTLTIEDLLEIFEWMRDEKISYTVGDWEGQYLEEAVNGWPSTSFQSMDEYKMAKGREYYFGTLDPDLSVKSVKMNR